MKGIISFLKIRKIALLISLFYVGIGTLAVCSIYPSDPLYGDWGTYALFVTFPVSILSCGFRYADSEILWIVFVMQFVMFLTTFIILSLFIKNNPKT
ncbi:hypothetical protein EG347_06815 [Chryseobacterium sp. G0186]|uniref:hypothetical protein n=1 Tax=Chryseobacterium sp. G0186 TaxID=2487064 RepID=UPI000F4D97EF|nr:hypothetical protein [Chryseobacterium sp. G0186]AZA77235.1 hypothetical protein EG347_06815 [Chryseobacterium sp. G0186]